jgi:hypothetical protein
MVISLSEEQFLQIDVLPKINSRLFLTSELTATVTTKDEDIVKTIGMITRMWKIFVPE